MPGMSLDHLLRRIEFNGDAHAAKFIAQRVLDADYPPATITEFLDAIPCLDGRLTGPVFDVLLDAFRAERALRAISAIPETDS